jgi:hypothetical protein
MKKKIKKYKNLHFNACNDDIAANPLMLRVFVCFRASG